MLAAVCRPRVCSTLSPAPANLVVALCGWRDFRTTASTQVRKDKILELAKGFRGRSKNCITVARARVEKGLQYAYRDRRNKKREFRSMWITRINAGVREHGLTYSKFTNLQNRAGIVLNRKILAELAVYEPYSFKSIVDVARAAESSSAEMSMKLKDEVALGDLCLSKLAIPKERAAST